MVCSRFSLNSETPRTPKPLCDLNPLMTTSPAEHLGRLASCPPSAVLAPLRSGWFCTQPPPFTYASRPKCSAGLVVIEGFRSKTGLGVLVASKYKINRLQGIRGLRKQLQIYEQNDALLHSALSTQHSALSKLRATPSIPPYAPRPTMPIRQH